MNIHYPYHFRRIENEDKIISLITSSHFANDFLGAHKKNDVKSILKPLSINVIILFVSDHENFSIYNELVLRLISLDYVVVTIKSKKSIDCNQCSRILANVTSKLKNDFMIKYQIDAKILDITFIGHNSSCNILTHTSFTNTHNKIILLDPNEISEIYPNTSLIESSSKPTNNIYIIVFTDKIYDAKTRKILETLTPNLYTLPNVNSTKIFNYPTSNLEEMCSRSTHLSNLSTSIQEIINTNTNN